MNLEGLRTGRGPRYFPQRCDTYMGINVATVGFGIRISGLSFPTLSEGYGQDSFFFLKIGSYMSQTGLQLAVL